MHDPMTVAHEIRYPWKKYGKNARNKFEQEYRESFITIWHVDPLNFKDKCGCRNDDSCGWHTPSYTKEQRETVKKLVAEQYPHIFEKQVRTAENASYASICFQPDCHAAVYWSWRAIKQNFQPQGRWQYGSKLSTKERELIYDLATCPVDNLQSCFNSVNSIEQFENFFFCVFRAFIRHRRPWYRHPRWHFWHWSFQVHPLQQLRRFLFDRCNKCGKGFGWNESPVSNCWDTPKYYWWKSRSDIYHGSCNGKSVFGLASPPTPDFDPQLNKMPTHSSTNRGGENGKVLH